MDLNYDYGDVVHKHKHIHSKPDSHRQVVEHALKEWCHDYFGDDAAEKCQELEDIKYHDIDDGQYDTVKVSDIYNLIKDFEKLNGVYRNTSSNPVEILNLNFKGSKLHVETSSHDLTIEKDDDGFFVLKADNYIIKEDGIYLNSVKLSKETEFDSGVVIRFKQKLRDLNMESLSNEIDKSREEVREQQEELLKRKHDNVNKFEAERKLEKLEIYEKNRENELIILIIMWIVGVLFGVYCIYTQFVLKLS